MSDTVLAVGRGPTRITDIYCRSLTRTRSRRNFSAIPATPPQKHRTDFGVAKALVVPQDFFRRVLSTGPHNATARMTGRTAQVEILHGCAMVGPTCHGSHHE